MRVLRLAAALSAVAICGQSAVADSVFVSFGSGQGARHSADAEMPHYSQTSVGYRRDSPDERGTLSWSFLQAQAGAGTYDDETDTPSRETTLTRLSVDYGIMGTAREHRWLLVALGLGPGVWRSRPVDADTMNVYGLAAFFELGIMAPDSYGPVLSLTYRRSAWNGNPYFGEHRYASTIDQSLNLGYQF